MTDDGWWIAFSGAKLGPPCILVCDRCQELRLLASDGFPVWPLSFLQERHRQLKPSFEFGRVHELAPFGACAVENFRGEDHPTRWGEDAVFGITVPSMAGFLPHVHKHEIVRIVLV